MCTCSVDKKQDIQLVLSEISLKWSCLNKQNASDPTVCYVCVLVVWQCQVRTYVWLLLGFPLLTLGHCLACFLAWLLVFAIPVAKMNARTLKTILLMPPEEVNVEKLEKVSFHHHPCVGHSCFYPLKIPSEIFILFYQRDHCLVKDHCLYSHSKTVRPKFCCAVTMLSTGTTTSTQ